MWRRNVRARPAFATTRGSLKDNEQHAPGDPAMALFQGPTHVSNASIRLLILHAVQLAFLAYHTKIPV
jgi:hypothetical protein